MKKLSMVLPNWRELLFRNLSIGRKLKGSDKLVVGIRLGLLWASAAVGFVGLLFGFDLIGNALEQCMTVLFELAQENLEAMYQKQFKLDLYHAQMATAYTGFVVFIGFGFLLVKKFSMVLRELKISWIRERHKAMELWAIHRENIQSWWNTLDKFNQISAGIALVMLAIPVISLICFALGKVVAEII